MSDNIFIYSQLVCFHAGFRFVVSHIGTEHDSYGGRLNRSTVVCVCIRFLYIFTHKNILYTCMGSSSLPYSHVGCPFSFFALELMAFIFVIFSYMFIALNISDLDIVTGVACQQEMLTPLKHLISLLFLRGSHLSK